MATIGIRELRQNASAVLRRVAAGETIDVTDRGHPVARIVPLQRESTLDQLVADGRATEARGDLLASELGQPIRGARSLSDVLAEMRAHER